jgi:Helitron helicase-like domain at N-terminus
VFIVEPGVVPLRSLGVIDAGATDLPDNTVLAHAFAKISKLEAEQGYAIKRSSDFVNEYPRKDEEGNRIDGGFENAEHLMGCFPELMPYAKGGASLDRPVPVSYEAHADWAMQYEDGRFAKHLQYMFQVFGVMQKRQVASSASLQISRRDFIRNEQAIRSLKPADLLIAAGEEHRKVPFSNPAVRSLRKHVSAIRAKVMGTDESRIKIRGQIWSTIVLQGPPSLWITINPSDTNDPIAQVLAGAEIDLDKFQRNSGPNSESRSRRIAADPHAASEFFHLIIKVVLEELFGLTGHTAHQNRKVRQEGIFGWVASYIGTVEAQGRGTLHLHMVLWLCGAPTAERMKELLKNESFRQRVTGFIKANIKADVCGADTRKLVEKGRDAAMSYSRPVDPRQLQYTYMKEDAERKLVRAVQVHQCSMAACLVMKKNRLQCKRRAPFELSPRDWIDEDGSWGPKRTYAYINNWNPAILHSVRSNHDVKLISNGTETKDLAFYITNYVAKKQRESSNVSALFAKRIAFHKKQEKYTVDVTALNRRLLQRCANTLSREQEFSAPEVSSYLRGHGDRYLSDFPVKVYLDSVRAALKHTYPNLRQKK